MVVTSKLLESGVIDFSNLNGEKGLPVKSRMNPGYCNSKLANAYFAAELAKRTENTGINVYMVCPGFTYTGLFRNVKRSWFHYIIFSPVALMFLRTPNQVNILPYVFKKIFHYSGKYFLSKKNKIFTGCANGTALCDGIVVVRRKRTSLSRLQALRL